MSPPCPGNPYDSHTLATVIPAMEAMIGRVGATCGHPMVFTEGLGVRELTDEKDKKTARGRAEVLAPCRPHRGSPNS
jgi:hypothetical protein